MAIRRFHGSADPRKRWGAGWLVAALWAFGFPLVSGLETQRIWGFCAGTGYLCAAVAAFLPPRAPAGSPAGVRAGARAGIRAGARAGAWAGIRAGVGCALAGAVVLPLLYCVLSGRAQSEVGVIERSGQLLLHGHSPYVAHPRTVLDYDPYLPGMAAFGLPRALFGDGGPLLRLLGDARVWCALVLLGCLGQGRRILRTPAAGETAPVEDRLGYGTALAALVASPVVALPLCVSGVDLPLTGLLCLALALAARGRSTAAGLAVAAACALKWTAWPALAVAASLLAHTAGRRAALRFAGVSVAGTLALVLPGVLCSPGAVAEQVVAFPTGRGRLATPARSLLPGRLLAESGPAGWYAAVALLSAGALAVGASLVVRPPSDAVAAADRLALGLCAGFLLAPAGRFGYLALPVTLAVWTRLAGTGSRAGRAAERRAPERGAGREAECRSGREAEDPDTAVRPGREVAVGPGREVRARRAVGGQRAVGGHRAVGSPAGRSASRWPRR